MTYLMKLQHSPFLAVKSGRKKIEMRLFDDKRKKLKVGDMVEFTDVKTGERLVCEVVQLHLYASFDELYQRHDKMSIGYEENEKANPEDMLAYYSAEDVQRYGVVGIELKIV